MFMNLNDMLFSKKSPQLTDEKDRFYWSTNKCHCDGILNNSTTNYLAVIFEEFWCATRLNSSP